MHNVAIQRHDDIIRLKVRRRRFSLRKKEEMQFNAIGAMANAAVGSIAYFTAGV